MTTTTRTPEWTLGDRLRKAREVAGMRQEDLAGALHISRTAIAGWENDKHVPSWAAVKLWAELTGVDLAWLEGDGTSTKWMWWKEPTLEGVEWHDWLKAS